MKRYMFLFVLAALGCSPGAVPIPSDGGAPPDADPVGLCSGTFGGSRACFSYLTRTECSLVGGTSVAACIGPYPASCYYGSVLILVAIGSSSSAESRAENTCYSEPGGIWHLDPSWVGIDP